jgi:hypothetical protein
LEGKVLDSKGFFIPLDWALWIKGFLSGLKDANDDALALGLIEKYVEERRVLRISTPLEIEKVKTLRSTL